MGEEYIEISRRQFRRIAIGFGSIALAGSMGLGIDLRNEHLERLASEHLVVSGLERQGFIPIVPTQIKGVEVNCLKEGKEFDLLRVVDTGVAFARCREPAGRQIRE